MPNETARLRELLRGTMLEACAVAALAVPESDEHFLAIDAHGIDPVMGWQLMRSLVTTTGRCPVLASLGAPASGPFEIQLEDAALFDRFYFEEEEREGRAGDSPRDIIAAAHGSDVFQMMRDAPEDEEWDLRDHLETEVRVTAHYFGRAPEISSPAQFIAEQAITSHKQLERWFLDWELENFPNALDLPENGLSHIEWHDFWNQYRCAILLMPSARGWEIPAYINWSAFNSWNSQFVIALLREWNAAYGAEVVSHDGMALQLSVARRPQDINEAFELAWRQEMLCSDILTLPGVSLRNHARALLHADRWSLFNKP